MHVVERELQNLEALCDRLEAGLERQYQHLRSHRFANDEESNEAALLVQGMQKAEKQFARLVRQHHANSGPASPEGSRFPARAAQLKRRAHYLLALVERNAAQCRELQHASQEALRELQVGVRFLRSVRGFRENQPRFLDARQ